MYLFGLPNLSDSDQARVRAGNAMYRHAMQVIRESLHTGGRGYLENPRGSRLFRTPGIQRLIRLKQAFLVRCDFCQYGTVYRKPTVFLIWGVAIGSVSLRTCSPVGGLCSATHKCHEVLTGKGSEGWRTRHAQAYPLPAARDLITQLSRAPPASPFPSRSLSSSSLCN